MSSKLLSVAESSSSFLRAARAGNLDKLLEYLKGSMDINTSNANGLNALHLASKEGHIHVVRELISRGAAVDAATKKGNTALHIASLAGQAEVVQILVEQGAKVNVQSQNGFTPLYMAAQENHSEVVKFLLANNANQTLSTEDGFTPLAVALQQGHDRVVAVLLENDSRGKVRLPALHIAAKKDDVKATTLLLQNEHNADTTKNGGLVNDTTKSGFTPLHIACHYGNISVGRLLIDKGADINYKARNSITPLHVASKWGRSNMVELLLDAKANIDARTRDGLTPLHCAARSGHDQVVDLLLEQGALVMCKTKNGLTPLHMSSQGDHLDCARLLLYHKAPIDEVTVDYLTPLHVVAHCGNVKTAKLLLDRKCEVNARALNGFTPLHIACKKNRIKIVELLLKYGASLEATTESGLTPLHVASFMGHMNIAIFLIQHGSNPNNTTMRGETALHLAARANQTDIIRILLRNGAQVDHAKAREQQTALHISSRLGNVDNVLLLLQHGASPDACTKDFYTPLHIAAKEGHDEVVQVLLEHGAKQMVTTKRGFTPLHVASKYGNLKVVQMLIQRGINPNLEGKNGLTPLHVATHYNRVNVALYLLEKNASPHCATKNGYTPLHIAAKKNQMDIATTLLEHGSNSDAESRNGFTPLHLAAQEGHSDMVALLAEHGAIVNCSAKNGLTPLHLTAQEDHVPVAQVLVSHKANIDPQTKAGYTPLHTACHFGQIGMIRFLLERGAAVNSVTKLGYTPLHQAAQQGHVLVNNLLLKYGASPNAVTSTGQTPLSIAQRLGYISVVEILKHITEVSVPPSAMEEKYKVMFPETMQEAPMSDSEEEGGEESILIDQSFQYLTTSEKPLKEEDGIAKENKDGVLFDQVSEKGSTGSSLGQGAFIDEIKFTKETGIMSSDFKGIKDDNMIMSFSECSQSSIKMEMIQSDLVPYQYASQEMASSKVNQYDEGDYYQYASSFSGVSNAQSYETSTDFSSDHSAPYSGFLVSFMVDARGGAMRGCRHSGVRIIIPPGKACMPTRVTCRLVKKEKVMHPPALMEAEALASRILEMGPVGAKFSGPVIIEVPHFASLHGKEREITVLRSENGQTWREHTVPATEEAVRDALQGSLFPDFESTEDLLQKRIIRILTTDLPQYFAVVARVRQETITIGPDGGMISSTVVPRVQAIFPEGSLTKNIKVGVQVQPVPSELVSKMLGNRVAVSPIVTVEPRRRKFHKPITLTIPVPIAAQKGMLNQYGGETPTLRLLCSIMGGTSPAQWEDITGTTPLAFINDCVSFTTTVSARFWLMDCQNVNESAKMASDLYHEIILVPFMSKFVVFAKRHDPMEGRLRVFCMTDDKTERLLETREQFKQIARSVDVEVLEGKPLYVEMGGNLIPVTKSGEKLSVGFRAFRENRLPFVVRVRDINHEASGLLAFMREPKSTRSEVVQVPACTLTIALPDYEPTEPPAELGELEMQYVSIKKQPVEEQISKAELWLTDIADSLGPDWIKLAHQMNIDETDIDKIEKQYADDSEKALVVLHLWSQRCGYQATGNELEKVLQAIGHEDIVQRCMYNIEEVTDAVEKVVARVCLDSTGFDALREELGSSQDSSVPRGAVSLDVSYEEQDIFKESESIADESTITLDGNNLELTSLDDGETIPGIEFPERRELDEEITDGLKLDKVDDQLSISDEHDATEKEPGLCAADDVTGKNEVIRDIFDQTMDNHGTIRNVQILCKKQASENFYGSNNSCTLRDLNKKLDETSSTSEDLCQMLMRELMVAGNLRKYNMLLDDDNSCYSFIPVTSGMPECHLPTDAMCRGVQVTTPFLNCGRRPSKEDWCKKKLVAGQLLQVFEADPLTSTCFSEISLPTINAFVLKSLPMKNFWPLPKDELVKKVDDIFDKYSNFEEISLADVKNLLVESKGGIAKDISEKCLAKQCPDNETLGNGDSGNGNSSGDANKGSTNDSNRENAGKERSDPGSSGDGNSAQDGNQGNRSPGDGNPGGSDSSKGGVDVGEIQTRTEVSEDKNVLPDGTVVKRKTVKRTFWREMKVSSTDGAGNLSPIVMEEIVRIEIDEAIEERPPDILELPDEALESETTTETSEYQMSNGAPVKKTLTKTRLKLREADIGKVQENQNTVISSDAGQIVENYETQIPSGPKLLEDQNKAVVLPDAVSLPQVPTKANDESNIREVSKIDHSIVEQITSDECSVKVKSDITEEENVLPDGTKVKKQTITKTFFKTPSSDKEEIDSIHIEELITEVAPGISEPFGDDVESKTTSDSITYLSPSGIPTQKKTVKITVQRKKNELISQTSLLQASEVPIPSVTEGNLESKNTEVKTDAHEEETVQADGTTVKRRIVTKTYVRLVPVEATEIADNKNTDVVKVEIEEVVTELAPGVLEPFGDDVETQKTTESFDSQLPNGAPVKRNLVKVSAHKRVDSALMTGGSTVEKAERSSSSVKENDGAIQIRTEVTENENVLGDGTTVKTKTTTRTFVKEIFASSGKSVEEVVQTEIDELVTENVPGVSEPYDNNIQTEVLEESSQFQLPNGSPVTKKVVKIVARPKEQVHALGVSENKPDSLAEVPHILATANQEIKRHHLSHGQFSPDNVEVRTDVTEDENVLADGTVVKKRTTTKTTVKGSSLNSRFENIIDTEIEERIVQMAPGITEPYGDNVETESSTESYRYYLDNGSPVVKNVVVIIANYPLGVRTSCPEMHELKKLESAAVNSHRTGVSNDTKKSVAVVNGVFDGIAPIAHPDVAKLLSATLTKKNALYKKMRNVAPDGSITEDLCTCDEDGLSDTSSVSDIRDLSPFAFSSTTDDLFLDDFEPGSLAIQVCTSTEDADPSIETDVKEYEDVLPDGTIVRRTVTKTIERKSFVNRVVIHVPHPSKSVNGDLALENFVEPYLAKYSHHCQGAPEVTTDTQEFEDVLPDGTVSKKRVTRKTEQQLSMERTLLIGNMPSLCGPDEGISKAMSSARSNIPAERLQGQGTQDKALVPSTQQLMRADDDEQVARVILRKQIHKKTIVQDGKEETIVTEDTQIEHDTNTPQELTDSIQELIQQFLDSNGEGGNAEDTSE